MKKNVFYLSILVFTAVIFSSCKPTINPIPEYVVSVEATLNKNAPALQSFSHATNGNEWLLFAGRTNQENDNGGLHDMTANSDYAEESFPPLSFNEYLYVYNPTTDAIPTSITIDNMLEVIVEKFPTYSLDSLTKYQAAFRNTNALVKQVNEYLIVVGGYGPKNFTTDKKDYITYNHVVKIHVPSLIALIKKDYDNVNEKELFAFGQNKSLVSTGGEMHYIGNDTISKGTFYLVGGHNFGGTAANGQKYVDAVYPFSISTNKTTHTLSISLDTPISDVSDPNGITSDDTSIFRRRDGPITPSLYFNSLENSLEESIAIYAGVFKPGEDLEAWNDAIYVHPNYAGSNSRLYTYDSSYNQKNFNVYSCPSLVAYDADTKTLHTFLLGGIGDGNTKKEKRLSGFTNTGTHIKLNVDKNPLKSSSSQFSMNLFSNENTNQKPFYGAEAIFFPTTGFKSTSIAKDIIDIKSNFAKNSNVSVGYIFGGIEAFDSHPGTYGRTKSRASNKIWKVNFMKQTID